MRPICLLGATMLMAACHHPIHETAPFPLSPTVAERAKTQPATAVTEQHDPGAPQTAEAEKPEHPPHVIVDVASKLEDIFYDYDRSELNDQAGRVLRADAEILKSILKDFPAAKIRIEGHCDERGSAEYNLALGDSRAARTAEGLRELGVTASRLETVSYGKENPQCTDSTESCWQKNRRAHFVISP
ncbi:MAG TPA: OmpA family protein [Bryobacteraceae bacterium]